MADEHEPKYVSSENLQFFGRKRGGLRVKLVKMGVLLARARSAHARLTSLDTVAPGGRQQHG